MPLVFDITPANHYVCESYEGPCSLIVGQQQRTRSAARGIHPPLSKCTEGVTIFTGQAGLRPECRFFVSFDTDKNEVVASTCPYLWTLCSSTDLNRVMLRTHNNRFLDKNLSGVANYEDGVYFQLPSGQKLDDPTANYNAGLMPMMTHPPTYNFLTNLKITLRPPNSGTMSIDRFVVCTAKQSSSSYWCGASETWPGHPNLPKDCSPHGDIRESC